jgi:hypothetical protein
MDIGVQRFFNKLEALQKKGLPRLLVLNDKLMTLSNYKQNISTMAKDNSKFLGITGQHHGQSILRDFAARPQHTTQNQVHFPHQAEFF